MLSDINFQMNEEKENRLNLDSQSLERLQSQQHFSSLLNLKQKSTIECSIQVNMDSEPGDTVDPTNKKKIKRKEYKKRKRDRCKEYQKQAVSELEKIIKSVYLNQTKYETQKTRIENCLFYLKGGDKFHEFLNDVIRDHNVQKQIWEYTQDILHQNVFENDDNQDFYLQMVKKIYGEYINIRSASLEIEKIINLYMRLTSDNFSESSYSSRDLDRSTFNYLIESDQSLKNLLRICDKKLSQKHHQFRFYLNKLLEMVNNLDSNEDTLYDDDGETQYSTSVSEEELKESMNNKKKKSKKKRKIRDEDMRCEYEDVLSRLEDFEIDDEDRVECKVEFEWVDWLTETLQKMK